MSERENKNSESANIGYRQTVHPCRCHDYHQQEDAFLICRSAVVVVVGCVRCDNS